MSKTIGQTMTGRPGGYNKAGCCRYSKEKEELDKVEARLAIIDAEKQIILAEQRAQEAKVRNAKLEEIRERRAAITLQRAWRQYKVLQQQSKKKKKGKKK